VRPGGGQNESRLAAVPAETLDRVAEQSGYSVRSSWFPLCVQWLSIERASLSWKKETTSDSCQSTPA